MNFNHLKYDTTKLIILPENHTHTICPKNVKLQPLIIQEDSIDGKE